MVADNRTDDQSAPNISTECAIDVCLTGMGRGADGINFYELARPGCSPLPTASPGAHIDLHLPNGMIRQYSLLTAEENPRCYSIGVKRDENSRGGSRYIHETWRTGAQLTISAPRNNFPLAEDAEHTIFIAGGIGITPIWCMLNRLHALGRSWQLYYACRQASQAIFIPQLTTHRQVHCHFDDRESGRFIDLSKIVDDAPRHSHLYCCGPPPMMAAFEGTTAAGWPAHQLHTEYFTAKQAAALERRFTVKLARSGREVVIKPGHSILKTLQAAGLNIAYSCEEGICGTCETRVLAGIPDHRDSVLTEADRISNTKIMICCSGSLTDQLVLDL